MKLLLQLAAADCSPADAAREVCVLHSILSLGFQHRRITLLAFPQRLGRGPAAAVTSHLLRVRQGKHGGGRWAWPHHAAHAAVFDTVANAGPHDAAATERANRAYGHSCAHAKERKEQGQRRRGAHHLGRGGGDAAYVSHGGIVQGVHACIQQQQTGCGHDNLRTCALAGCGGHGIYGIANIEQQNINGGLAKRMRCARAGGGS